jgi:hypothetical protein
VRAALKVTLEKGPTQRWIIGSNDAATITFTRAFSNQRVEDNAFHRCGSGIGRYAKNFWKCPNERMPNVTIMRARCFLG